MRKFVQELVHFDPVVSPLYNAEGAVFDEGGIQWGAKSECGRNVLKVRVDLVTVVASLGDGELRAACCLCLLHEPTEHT